MCGRFVNINEKKKIQKIFNAKDLAISNNKSFNVAPGRNIDVIFIDEGDYFIDSFYWGYSFIDKKSNVLQNVINSRLETINTKLLFKDSYLRRKCIILANGYYEWKNVENNKKPYFISLPVNELICFAGIWRNEIKKGNKLKVCNIITKSANSKLSFIHNRMPFILSIPDSIKYLNDTTNTFSFSSRESNIEEDLDYYEISKYVNNPSNDSKECINPIKLN